MNILRVIFVVLAMQDLVLAQEPVKEPRFYVERLVDYYRGINTISAEFTYKSRSVDAAGSVQVEYEATCRYWQKGADYRQENITANAPADSDVLVFKDGITKRLFDSQKDDYLQIYKQQGGLPGLAGQFLFCQKDLFEKVLDEPGSFASVEMSAEHAVDDARLVEVALNIGFEMNGHTGSIRMKLRLDPDRKYAPARITEDVVAENTTSARTYEVGEFLDAGHGYSVPRRITETAAWTKDGEAQGGYEQTIQMSRVEINGVIDDGLFDVVVEPGTHVNDSVAGFTYNAGKEPVGLDESVIPPDRPGAKTEPLPGVSSAPNPVPAAKPPSTQSNPSATFSRLLAPAAVLLAVVVAAAWQMRRYQKRRRPTP